MQVYLAGPLFSEGERAYLDRIAAAVRAAGFDCFVPHEQFGGAGDDVALTADEVYRVDGDGLRAANAVLAWLDGPLVDDGTAAEIGAFAELVRARDGHHVGIVGLVTDLRLERRRGAVPGDGLNLFVAGAIQASGRICWSLPEALGALETLALAITSP